MKETTIVLLLLLFCYSCYSQVGVPAPGSTTDPCKSYRVLKNIENRDPRTLGRPTLVDDSKLRLGWYAAPENWKLLDRVPSSIGCGTQFPVYRRSKYNGSSEMCYRVPMIKCYLPFFIKTRMCGNREIYYLWTKYRGSGFCFFNTGPCAKNPCANGGTCRPKNGTYSCICASGFTGWNCKENCNQPLDILIMEDVSRSIGKESFEEVRRFEQSLLSPFTISPNADNVAYMVFSTNARVEFSFSEYSNSKSSVLAALQNQVYESGSTTDFGEAINVAVNSVFTLSKGDRPNADNVVIMFTDGFDTESKRKVIDANIRRLHAKAEVFVVALSDVGANSTVNSLAPKPNIFRIGSNDTVRSEALRVDQVITT